MLEKENVYLKNTFGLGPAEPAYQGWPDPHSREVLSQNFRLNSSPLNQLTPDLLLKVGWEVNTQRIQDWCNGLLNYEEYKKFRGPSGAKLQAGEPLVLFTLSFFPFRCSGRVHLWPTPTNFLIVGWLLNKLLNLTRCRLVSTWMVTGNKCFNFGWLRWWFILFGWILQ